MNIAIIPHSEELMKEPTKQWRLYSTLQDKYKGTEYTWKILSEYKDWSLVDYFVFYNFNYSWGISILKKINKMHRKNRIIFVMMEPDTVYFFHSSRYLPLIRKFTDCIITWNKDIVDGENIFFSFFHGWLTRECKSPNYKPLPFDEKKLLCNISCNKESNNPNELYTERKKVIEYFELKHHNDFDLYGRGWDKKKYRSYMGEVETKGEIYRNYKFALALENEKNVKGYITEKILDCIYYGIVPVYYGADDILEYIPEECFIRYDKFHSIDEMYNFLINVIYSDYEKYIDAQRKFIAEKRYVPFSMEQWGENVINAIECYNKSGTDVTPKIWFIVIHFMYIRKRIESIFRKILKRR